MLTKVENTHTYICWTIKVNLCLAPVDGYQVFTKYLSTLERWIGCKLLIFLGICYRLDYRDALPLSKVFHSLAKDTIVHELEEVFFKVILCFGSEGCIHLYIWLHPGRLIELNRLINMFQYHSLANIVLEISVVDDIFIFIKKIRDELFCGHISLAGTLD